MVLISLSLWFDNTWRFPYLLASLVYIDFWFVFIRKISFYLQLILSLKYWLWTQYGLLLRNIWKKKIHRKVLFTVSMKKWNWSYGLRYMKKEGKKTLQHPGHNWCGNWLLTNIIQNRFWRAKTFENHLGPDLRYWLDNVYITKVYR